MSNAEQSTTPAATRPHIAGYGVPESESGLLPWSHVRERMAAARNYWICTVRPDGRPHAVPVWAVWVDDRLYFGGGPNTRWVRNMTENPAVALHLESGDDVVMMEGTVALRTEEMLDPAQWARISNASQAKYDMAMGAPVWELQPHTAFAWTEFPKTATRWTLSD